MAYEANQVSGMAAFVDLEPEEYGIDSAMAAR